MPHYHFRSETDTITPRLPWGLSPGTRLGPYEIVAPLGAGGIGEVYRARDSRLDRTVAIKILNSPLVESAALRARFEREAKIVSQLQHPNICLLHDVGSDGGTEYLAMESKPLQAGSYDFRYHGALITTIL